MNRPDSGGVIGYPLTILLAIGALTWIHRSARNGVIKARFGHYYRDEDLRVFKLVLAWINTFFGLLILFGVYGLTALFLPALSNEYVYFGFLVAMLVCVCWMFFLPAAKKSRG
jgi:hypothetical protein